MDQFTQKAAADMFESMPITAAKCEKTLYRKEFEHDACGIGAVVSIKGIKTHKTVDDALKIVEKLEHRAGKDAEGLTGDGVGIMLQISHSFFSQAAAEAGIKIGEEGDYAVGILFLPQEVLKCNQAKKMFEITVGKEGLPFLGWREVPTNPDILGARAREAMPVIMQCFIGRPENANKGFEFDRRLYVARRVFEQSSENTYIVSLSSRSIVYKGMFLVDQLRNFYSDLQDSRYESAIALVHSRFSTNTNPSWDRAHPNRIILHNGEINTIRGNVDRMLAREETMHSPLIDDEIDKIFPVVNESGSDSAMLDNTLEFLMMSGMELPLAVMITIPEPWSNDKSMDRRKKDLYKYYATMMEPWDGPAAILFSDGDIVGAVLDRNGLRPSRYYITDDDYLVLSSEVGVLDAEPDKIVKKSRLSPGKMLLVDTKKGRLIGDEELKNHYARRQPYGEWIDHNLLKLSDLHIPNHRVESYSPQELTRLQKAFGYTNDDIKNMIIPMAISGTEPTASMGADTPLAAVSDRHQPLFNYFKQQFAQVTNPPIDAIREEIVTSTTVYLGDDGNLLTEKAENCTVLRVNNPILTSTDMLKIKNMKRRGFHVEEVSILYYKNTSLKKALDHMFVKVDKAYRNGANIVILTDRGVNENHVAIPSLLAVSALEQYLIRTKKRTAISVVLESAEPRDVHHFAALLGYGARAVNPYLAQDTIAELVNEGLLDKDPYAAISDYNDAVLHGVLKIASKMGISTLQSYQSAQIFEAIGINKEVIDIYFTNTISRIEGIDLKRIEEDVDFHHSKAFDPLESQTDAASENKGSISLDSGKEEHLYNPKTIRLLQEASRRGDYELFKQYTALVNDETKTWNLRGLMGFRFADEPVPIDEVESVDSIVKRFKTGAMSYGSLSQEAHETMAIAMNALGGMSNCGEGGEARDRFEIGADGLNRCSAIKQVASGRFGVTSEYLMSAKDIQIKMAQGAKPGEGGHLPGGKVYPWIAKVRHSTTGVSLISPPPHHDIYSIEDLAQLIYDLKNANRDARISVKLVSEAGVGTVAAGVAKAGAQVILISGFDGGTGAAPRTSITSAGLPWELGLAETHQTLIKNGLRSRVRLETDGKLMTGRDVAVAAMLGAEEFGFATAPLVTMGCVMMRVCNRDTCPVGIATQKPELRKRFKGKPEYVMNFMKFIAQELREYMSQLGIKTVDELVGRTDLLYRHDDMKNGDIDLSAILDGSHAGDDSRFKEENIYDFHLEKTLDEKVLLNRLESELKSGEPGKLRLKVSSTDRTLGTIFGSEITRLHGSTLPDDTFVIKCEGGGGQSFGAFIPNGLTLELEGDVNDYMGKGLSGGKIIVYPPCGSTFKPEDNIIIGNVALYGATSGKAFVNGIAGERFCVRNSGASAVVEGTGDHGCEYMTGGRVVVLGPTGKNFAAGMSGGIAYVLDMNTDLYLRLNKNMVSEENVCEKHDVSELKSLIEEHVSATGSPKGREILENFKEYLPYFKKIIPHDYRTMLQTMAQLGERGMPADQAEIEAFYEISGKAE